MSSYALQGIWSYCKLWYAFTKTSLHLCYKYCLVLFESSWNLCIDLKFRKPWFLIFKSYPKNPFQNQSTFWGWTLKQSCRACWVVQSLFLEFFKLFSKNWSYLKRRNSLNVPYLNSKVHFKMYTKLGVGLKAKLYNFWFWTTFIFGDFWVIIQMWE